jgi:hypothetical protein
MLIFLRHQPFWRRNLPIVVTQPRIQIFQRSSLLWGLLRKVSCPRLREVQKENLGGELNCRKMAFMLNISTASFSNIWFLRKTQFCLRKLVKIAENCDHNIDSWKTLWKCFFFLWASLIPFPTSFCFCQEALHIAISPPYHRDISTGVYTTFLFFCILSYTGLSLIYRISYMKNTPYLFVYTRIYEKIQKNTKIS